MPFGCEIVATDAGGNRTVEEYAYTNQTDAKGDILELSRNNPHMNYNLAFGEIEADRLHDRPRYHPIGRYRGR